MIETAIPTELIEAINRGSAVLFVGPELSITSGLASWSQLARELAERLELSYDEQNLEILAELYEKKFSRNSLINYVRERYDIPRITPSPIHQMLAKLPLAYIITTNYDTLLESSFSMEGRPYNVVTKEADLPYISEDRVQIIKLYGSVDQPTTLLLTSDDQSFFDSGGGKGITSMLRFLFETKSVIFLGYSPSSVDFKHIYNSFRAYFRPPTQSIYFVTSTIDSDQVEFFEKNNIRVIFSNLENFFVSLVQLGNLFPSGITVFPTQTPQTISIYRNFYLRVSDYKVILIESPAGEAETDFELPLSRQSLEEMLLRIRRNEGDEDTVRQIGTYLFSALFNGPIKMLFDRSLAFLSSKEGLRINLRIESAELASLPWELLYDLEHDEYLALSLRTPLTRYYTSRTKSKDSMAEIALPLRILVISTSKGFNIEREEFALEKALDSLIQKREVVLRFIRHPTINLLQHELRRERFHILHYIGHGSFKGKDSYLALEDEYGKSALVSADRLSYQLRENGVRLVVLNACESARVPGNESSMSIGAALVRAGIPASVDMQFQIDDDSALAFSRDFYSAIADGLPVDASLQEARKSLALVAGMGKPDWASPVLFSRIRDEVIFAFQKRNELSALAINFFNSAGFEASILTSGAKEVTTDLLLKTNRPRYSKYGHILVRCLEASEIEIEDINNLRNFALSYFRSSGMSRGLKNKLALLVSSKRPNRAVLLSLYTYKEQDDFTIVPIEEDVIRSALSRSDDASMKLDNTVDQYSGNVNLYEARLPITDPMWFFGRDLIIHQFLDYVHRPQHIGLFGQRKIGKTSVIKQMTYKLVDDLVCYIDLQTMPNDCRYLYERIVQDLSKELCRFSDKKNNLMLLKWDFSSAQDIIYAFRQDMIVIRDLMLQINPDHKIVIILDEIDRMLPSTKTVPSGGFAGFEEFLALLRGISQEDNRLVLIVTSIDAEINRVGRWSAGTGRDNPVRESFIEIFLPPLKQDDCEQMIVSIGSFMGVSYTKSALNAIYNSTSGHPFITRQLCSSIINSTYRHIDLLEVQEGIERFLHRTSYFRVMWNDLDNSWGNEAQLIRSFLINMALGYSVSETAKLLSLSTEKLNAMLEYLNEQYLLKKMGDNYLLSMDLFSEWIRRNKATRT